MKCTKIYVTLLAFVVSVLFFSTHANALSLFVQALSENELDLNSIPNASIVRGETETFGIYAVPAPMQQVIGFALNLSLEIPSAEVSVTRSTVFNAGITQFIPLGGGNILELATDDVRWSGTNTGQLGAPGSQLLIENMRASGGFALPAGGNSVGIDDGNRGQATSSFRTDLLYDAEKGAFLLAEFDLTVSGDGLTGGDGQHAPLNLFLSVGENVFSDAAGAAPEITFGQNDSPVDGGQPGATGVNPDLQLMILDVPEPASLAMLLAGGLWMARPKRGREVS